jgi:polysaccharide pyruvyl transferase WcaK-like protein
MILPGPQLWSEQMKHLRMGEMDFLTQADKKICLLHHAGGGNLGDDATLDAVAENIKRRWPTAQIVALSMNPDHTARRHGIISHALRRKGWSVGYTSMRPLASFKGTVKALTRKYKACYLLQAASAAVRLPGEVIRELSFLVFSLRKIRAFELLIVSGGGQLTEKDGPWGFPYTIFKWVVLARFAGVRCIFLNVGAGPLTRRLSKFFVVRALAAADYVSLRDDKSQALVHEIGFTGKSRVYPDNVYGLEIATANGNPLDRSAQQIVGFAPMPYPDLSAYPTEADQIVYGELIRKLAVFASWLIEQPYALTIFGTDIGVDPLAVEDLQIALRTRHGVTPSQYRVCEFSDPTHTLFTTMSRMDYIVTCRFHGVIFAHLLNKPVLAIAHHPKVSDLMATLGLSSYCVDIRDFDPRLLMERFSSMVINAEEIRSRMAASLTRNRQRLRNQFDELFDIEANRKGINRGSSISALPDQSSLPASIMAQ